MPLGLARSMQAALARLHAPAIVLSVSLLAGCQTRTDALGRTVASTPTFGQLLEITSQTGGQPGSLHAIPMAAAGSVQDQRVIAGRTVQVVAAQGGHRVLIDARAVAIDRDDDRVVIRSTHEGSGRIYVLIEEQSGGNACPSMFQAIDLSGGAVMISPRFGNCSDVPQVSISGGALRVSVPAFRAGPAATFMFRNGRLSHT